MTVLYTRAEQVLHRHVGPDVIALLPGQSDVHLMAGPAAVMWELLIEELSLGELVGQMAELYVRPARAIAPSIEGCLEDLAHRGLVEQRSD